MMNFFSIMRFYIIVWAVFSIFSLSDAAAEDLNNELDYRVRFSKASDVKLLLGKGADANYVNKTGMTMAAVAVSRKDSDALPVLKVLTDAGADINDGGNIKQYPLMIALRDKNVEIVKYLVFEKQAELNIYDANGMTPLEIAEYNADDYSVQIIGELKEKREAQLMELQNPIRRNGVMQKWAQLQCEQHYMQHYFAVKLDKKTPEEMKQELDKYPPQFKEMSKDLKDNFNINTDNFGKYVAQFVNPRLNAIFAKMPSNRTRRKAGFGKIEDRTAKCEKIAAEFAQKLPK